MISFVFGQGEHTHLVGFNKHMRKIAELFEDENEWTLKIGNSEFRVNGNGCSDPIEYVERIASPQSRVAWKSQIQNTWFASFKFHDTGESWEVWGEDFLGP